MKPLFGHPVSKYRLRPWMGDHLFSLEFSEICEIDLFLLHLTISSPSDDFFFI